MIHRLSTARRALVIAAVLLASAAVLGFSQQSQVGTTSTNPGHPSEPGVVVVSVQPGSPAEKAGIVRGDIILAVNGADVNTMRDIQQAIAPHKDGETVSVKLRHGDAEKTLSVALAARDGRAYLGLLLFPDGRERFAMREPREGHMPWDLMGGALVAKVAPGGPAAKAGLKRGDVILSVDGVQIDADHGLSSLIQEKKVGDTVTLSVKARQEGTAQEPRDVKVTLGTSPAKKPWLGVEYMTGLPTAMLPDTPTEPGEPGAPTF